MPREDNNESGQIGIRGKFTTGGISNEINLGGSINLTENRNAFAFGAFPTATRAGCGIAAATSSSFCSNLYAPVVVARPANGLVGGNLGNVPRVSKTEFASYFLSDTLGIADDRILLTVGARRQFLTIEGYDRASLRRTTRYHESATTPVIGLIVRDDLALRQPDRGDRAGADRAGEREHAQSGRGLRAVPLEAI